MNFDPADMVNGIEAAFEDEDGFIPDAPESVHRLADLVCSLLNGDGVYTKQDLEYHIRSMAPLNATALARNYRAYHPAQPQKEAQ